MEQQGIVSRVVRNRPFRMSPAGMNKTIAIRIFPNEKGWAWKKGQPIDFGQPCERVNLANWSRSQPWWRQVAPETWYEDSLGVNLTPEVIYNHMCLDYGAGKIKEHQLAYHFRNLVAESIEAWVTNGNQRQPDLHSQKA